MEDPFSAAMAVVAAFQAVYLTSRFIYREVLKAKGFHDGKAKMAQKYRFEIVRLKAFWMDILEVIHTILSDVGAALNAYSQVASELGEEYKKYYTERSLLAADAIKFIELPLDLDDAIDPTGEELDAEKGVLNGPSAPDTGGMPKHSSFLDKFFGRSGKKPGKEPTVVLQAKWKELPQGITWCFQERQLNKSLKILKLKMNELNDWAPFLVASLDRSSAIGHKVDTDRVFKDFKGHMLIQQMAKNYRSGITGTSAAQIPWETMRGYINDSEKTSSRILIERKETGNFPRNSKEAAAVKEREEEAKYAPQLASLLMSSSEEFLEEATLGTLPFKGFSKDTTVPNGCFSFAFNYPEGALDRRPLSLQQLILSEQGEHKLSLNDRFHVAKMVSRYLGTLHSDGWLHKSIRSHAVKFFFRKADKAMVLDTSSPYLTDFGFSRPLGGFSAAKYSASTAVNLDMDVYRHPHRFGKPSQSFNMAHDVYSLGIVLLEIGVWKTARQMYDEAFEPVKEKPTGEDVKAAFIRLARQELEHHMGLAYRNAVLLCLDGEHVRKSSLAVEFQKNVVQKVDAARLNAGRADFDDEAESSRYDAIVPS